MYTVYKPNKENNFKFSEYSQCHNVHCIQNTNNSKHNIQIICSAVFSDNSEEKNFIKGLAKETISCYTKENEREENNND